MPTAPPEPKDATARPAPTATVVPGVLQSPAFLPRPGEPLHAYAARLRAIHHQLALLIDAVEHRLAGGHHRTYAATAARARGAAPPPATVAAPAAPPATERRLGQPDRRTGYPDRRRGLGDLRAERVERRTGPRDRRTGPRDRRVPGARRPPSAPAPGPLDPIAVFWGVNVACWLGVTAVAMVWGVG